MQEQTSVVGLRQGGLYEARSTPLLCFTVMVGAWMFDFQADASGAGLSYQLVFLAVYLLGLIMYLITEQTKRPTPGLGVFGASLMLYLLVAILSGIAQGQDFYILLRQGLSVFLYGSATVVTARLLAQCEIHKIRKTLAGLCLGFAVSTFFIVLLGKGGIDLSTVRFEIIGGSTIAALGYLACAALFRLRLVETATLIVTLMLVFISITRTYFLVILAETAPIVMSLRRVLTFRFIMIAVFLAMVAGAYAGASSQLTDRWIDHFLNSRDSQGGDITWSTRTSETDYMLGAIVDGPARFLFGNGLAGKMYYIIPREAGGGENYDIGFGHEQHVSEVFDAGVLGAGPLLFVQFQQAFLALLVLVRLSFKRQEDRDELFLAAWGATIVIGFITTDFLSSTFDIRGASLWYGIGTGLLLGSRGLLSQSVVDPHDQPPAPSRADTRGMAADAQRVPPAVLRRWQALKQAKSNPQ